MSKYRAYPIYKDSGVEWLGEVPENWETIKLRFLLSENLSNGIFKKIDSWGTGFLIVNVFDVYIDTDIINENLLDRVECSEDELQKYSAKHGDFFFVRSSLKTSGVGKSAMVLNPTEYIVFECHLVRGRPDLSKIEPRFLNLYLNALFARHYLVSMANFVTMATIDQTKFKDLPVCIPTFDEQQQIAAFLDNKTAHLDTLIEKKQQMIGLLNEKRIALITQAVTKGLDLSVPMKDSGVEWLGSVPEHWGVMRISHVSILKSGDAIVSEQIGDTGTYPVYGGNGLRGYFENFNHDGDYILIGRQGALCGNINYGYGKFWASEHAVVVHPTLPLNFKWLGETLRVMNLNQYNVSSAQPGLAITNIVCLKIPFPTVQEQNNIALYIENETAKIDRMINTVQSAIAKLQEYRTALITAAVTGKIDVRTLTLHEG